MHVIIRLYDADTWGWGAMMETLIIAIVGLVGFVTVVFVFGAVSEKLKERTGKDFGDWFWTVVNTGLAIGVGYGGLSLVLWGMREETVALVIVGIVVMVIAAVLIVAAWSDDGGSVYNPMSSKRAHYNKDGKLTGYSDKE